MAKIRWRRAAKLALWGLAVVAVLLGLYLSIFFFPYPLFPHHVEYEGFDVYSDAAVPEGFAVVMEDAQRRTETMELYRGDKNLRIFICSSRRLFVLINRLAGKRHFGQALVISVAGNAFFSEEGIDAVGRRNGGRPKYSRLEGSWSGAIAHEVAHDLVFTELGFRRSKRIPVWKSEGYADYQANRAAAASDPDYVLVERVAELLDDRNWQPPATSFDRRHFQWHLMVEYLCTVRGFTFKDLLDLEVTETAVRKDLMTWYSAAPMNNKAPTLNTKN